MNIAIQINKQTLTALPDGPLVAASVGVVTCTTEFDPSWEGFTKTLVFTRDGLSRAVLWTGEEMTVPWEVLAQPGLLYISALGVKEGMRLPTAVMEEPLSVRPSGQLRGGLPGEYTETIWNQTMAEVQRLRDEAVKAAEAAQRAAEAAEALLGTPGVGEPVRWEDLLDKPFDCEAEQILYLGSLGAQAPWTDAYKDVSAAVTLTDGAPYQVLWNEETYLCTCEGGLGNLSLTDGSKTDTGEPFAILPITGGLRIYGYTGAEVTLMIASVRITKKLNSAFVDLEIPEFPEATDINWCDLKGKPIAYEMSGVTYMGSIGAQSDWTEAYKDITADVTLTEGGLYLAQWNGVDYLCIYQNGCLGNAAMVSASDYDTGEPFAVQPISGGLRVYGYTGAEVSLVIGTVTVTRKLHGAFLDLPDYNNLDEVSY